MVWSYLVRCFLGFLNNSPRKIDWFGSSRLFCPPLTVVWSFETHLISSSVWQTRPKNRPVKAALKGSLYERTSRLSWRTQIEKTLISAFAVEYLNVRLISEESVNGDCAKTRLQSNFKTLVEDIIFDVLNELFYKMCAFFYHPATIDIIVKLILLNICSPSAAQCLSYNKNCIERIPVWKLQV